LGALIAVGGAALILALSGGHHATSGNRSTLSIPATTSAIVTNPAAETGARLDHSGRNATLPQPSVSNYPDAPQPAASTTKPTVSNYPDAPPPAASTTKPTVSNYLDAQQPVATEPSVSNYPDAPRP
jgi:hypothetical protein